ncbi:AAA family ATPase [Clostridium tagluense]|uniref:AAA family ATPase n=1 Tax=Clostridium TaxID=1485 RepID=UPI0013E8F5EA|nr:MULTISPECIES: MoxR family ATPase [Clostridium]MBU3127026.1 AAA family ATPase [Clostridium tagluense]MBZ9625312.1 AAA family ATPase [Clostridium sp. FP2]MCB2299951.1 AAA family ATPase [Clostridium tagluense]MCB2311028.1 AAA family ATPase [Clostridium tagluense]MCB2316886.1 AAA family ATPase [Clostridium tagluense]
MTNEVELVHKIADNIEKVILGKRLEVYNILKGILANGHILIEDIPGVGKTTLIKALAKSLSLSYSRIQFTPDLLPSDIIGVSIYNQKTMEFEYKKGPIFSNIVLADEINRTSPKTQSALLEAMEEKQISEGGITYKLKEPFLVLATENPIEYEGTFSLPEAQLDRFMIKVSIGYPNSDAEVDILELYRQNNPIEELEAVATEDDIIYLQKKVRDIHVEKELNEYIVRIVNATRNNSFILLGGSIRASLALQRLAQATALINGRDYIIPEDIRGNVMMVLSHRITLTSSARANNYSTQQVISDILKTIQVPKVK